MVGSMDDIPDYSAIKARKEIVHIVRGRLSPTIYDPDANLHMELNTSRIQLVGCLVKPRGEGCALE